MQIMNRLSIKTLCIGTNMSDLNICKNRMNITGRRLVMQEYPFFTSNCPLSINKSQITCVADPPITFIALQFAES